MSLLSKTSLEQKEHICRIVIPIHVMISGCKFGFPFGLSSDLLLVEFASVSLTLSLLAVTPIDCLIQVSLVLLKMKVTSHPHFRIIPESVSLFVLARNVSFSALTSAHIICVSFLAHSMSSKHGVLYTVVMLALLLIQVVKLYKNERVNTERMRARKREK